ncbi:MAG: FliA/WhiG family RNA polymerase sigma factor [Syntrophotaleaceae bacterium]
MKGAVPYSPPGADAKDRLIKAHLHLVSFLADRMVTQVPAFMSREDIASAAMLGLVDAAGRFDPGHGVLFKTFAEKRMRGAVLDEVRRMDWFSRTLRKKQGQIQRAIEDLERSLGRDPEEQEIAAALHLSLEEYRQLLGETSHLGCISLHETIGDSEHGPSLLDNLANKDEKSAQDMLEASELARQLAEHIDRLSEKERLVVTLYYYEELSQKEIAEVLEISEGRVSQLHSQALIKLKTHIGRSHKRRRSPLQR